MNVFYTAKFKSSFQKFPEPVRRKFIKQITYMIADLKHPSLHAKKYDEQQGIWQTRVDRSIRFYFLIEKDTFILLEMRTHPK